MPKGFHIFISYAHRDASQLAFRLHTDLNALGCDAWLDVARMQGGDRWTNEIEAAIDRSDVMLALLSDGSFTSDTCRAEQRWALDARKRVIPILVQKNARAQLHLRELHFLDFTDTSAYAESFAKLQQSLRQHDPITPTPATEPRYNNTPALPNNFVDRPELLARLRDALFLEGPQRNIGLTALHGMGGIGKTVLAQALCHDPAVRYAYPDGIFWFSIGRESRLAFHERIETVPGVKELLGAYKGEDACISQYRNALRDKAALIVLDDVWSAADIEPFRLESPRSRLLFTTRDGSIAPSFGARSFTAELLSEADARKVLACWAGLTPECLPTQATKVIAECKNLALALAMIGAQLRGKAAAHWDLMLGHLRRADLTRIRARFAEPHTSLSRAIEVSVEALRREDDVAAQRYLALAILLEDMAASPVIQQTLWNTDKAGALETSSRFVELSLATLENETGAIRLHDLQLDYVRMQYPAPEALPLIQGALRLSAEVIRKDPLQFASQIGGRLLRHASIPAIRKFLKTLADGAPKPWLRPLRAPLRPPGTPLLHTLEGHSGPVNGVALTADGKRVISVCSDDTLKVWDLESGRELHTLEGYCNSVNRVALIGDGEQAVSVVIDSCWNKDICDWDWCIRLTVWDLESGCEVHTLKLEDLYYAYGDIDAIIAVAADGKRALSVLWTATVWDLESGRKLRTLEGDFASVNGVAVTPDGKRALFVSWAGATVWDLESGCKLRTLEGHFGSVNGVAVSPDGKRAIFASADTVLKVWDLESGRELRTLEGHFGSVNGVAVSPDGKCVVSASDDATLNVWDLGDLESGYEMPRVEGHTGSVNRLSMTPDGKHAVSASADKTLKVWDLESGLELYTLGRHLGSVNGVAVTPDGKRAISASDDTVLKVWDLESGRELRTLEGHSGAVNGVAFTADGKWAVSASSDTTLKIWDMECGAEGLRTLKGHSRQVYGLSVTPDGKHAVSASADKTLKVWDLESGRELRTLEGHSGLVNGVAVAADGKWAVSASADKTLKAWDIENGLPVATFHCDAPAATSCVFVNDAHLIVAGDSVGGMYFLSLEVVEGKHVSTALSVKRRTEALSSRKLS